MVMDESDGIQKLHPSMIEQLNRALVMTEQHHVVDENSGQPQVQLTRTATRGLEAALHRVSLPESYGSTSTHLNQVSDVNIVIGAERGRTWFAKKVRGWYATSKSKAVAEFQALINDLPSAKFISILSGSEDEDGNLIDGSDATPAKYYAARSLGRSFYAPLFPSSSLHVFFSSHSLQWLSKVPDIVLQKDAPAYNRGRTWPSHEDATLGAFREQAKQDMKQFLDARSHELVPGGLLFLVFSGRRRRLFASPEWDDYSAEFEQIRIWEETWNQLLAEGVLIEEQRDGFNLPLYSRTLEDVTEVLQMCSEEFHVADLELRETEIPAEIGPSDLATRCITVAGRLVDTHLGPDLASTFWRRFQQNLTESSVDYHDKPRISKRFVISLVRR